MCFSWIIRFSFFICWQSNVLWVTFRYHPQGVVASLLRFSARKTWNSPSLFSLSFLSPWHARLPLPGPWVRYVFSWKYCWEYSTTFVFVELWHLVFWWCSSNPWVYLRLSHDGRQRYLWHRLWAPPVGREHWPASMLISGHLHVFWHQWFFQFVA